MLEDYFSRLQQVQKDRNKFLKLKYKANTKSTLVQQQNKYHKYILNQISQKKYVDSILIIYQILNNSLRKIKKLGFQHIQASVTSQRSCQQINECQQESFSTKSTRSMRSQRQKTQTTQKILAFKSTINTLSTKLIVKILSQRVQKNKRSFFSKIQRKNRIMVKLNKSFQLLVKKNTIVKKQVLKKLKQSSKTHEEPHEVEVNKSFIFSMNEFSQIIPYTIQQDQDQFSQSSGINKNKQRILDIDKNFKPIMHIDQSNKHQQLIQQCVYFQLKQSCQKLHQQILIMKNIIQDKNKQLKSKNQYICKIKKQYQSQIQHLYSQFNQKVGQQFKQKVSFQTFNTKNKQNLYYKELQNIVIGDRNQLAFTQAQNNDLINEQLVSKYMKQSFQIRQKMDMARQMCEQFQFDTRTEEGQIMIQIIRLLTPEERLNVQVD